MSKQTITTIILTVLIYFAIDMLWLQVISKDFYTISYSLILNQNPNLIFVFLFYILYPICIFFLVIKPNFKLSKLIFNGALLGFAAYLTYDLTAAIIIKNFPASTIIPDILWGTFVTCLVSILGGIIYNLLYKPQKVKFGTTFSHLETDYLKIDRFATLEKILSEFKFDTIRLGAYWDEIEKFQGIYDFSSLDKELELCRKYNIRVTLAIGRKTPRWPEYNEPNWFKQLLNEAKDDFVRENLCEQYFLPFLTKVIENYKYNHLIEKWQIENEAFYKFGVESYQISEEFLKKEVQLVKSIDNTRSLLSTDSGFSMNAGKLNKYFDQIGLNLYFTIARKSGYVKSRFPKIYYVIRQMWIGKKFYVSELQVEPWLHEKYQSNNLDSVPVEELDKSASSEIILDNFVKTKNLGFDEIHFWGAEYLVYMQENRNLANYSQKVRQIIG